MRTAGVILKSYRIAEYHKGIVVLSPDLGMLNATVFGAYKGKSKLSGVSEAYSLGDFLLYHDPVKDRYKVTEITPRKALDNIRQDLDLYYTASFWSELLIKSFAGGGEFERLYRFVATALQQLNDAARSELVNIQFMWRYLGIIGFQPEIRQCNECGRVLEREEKLYYQNGDFVGQECRAAMDAPFLSAAARNYLLHSASLPMQRTVSVDLPERERQQLKKLLFLLIEDMVGFPLNTLKQGLI